MAYTGLFTALGSTRIALQTTFNNKTVAQNYEAKVTSGTGYGATYYSNNNYPNINIEVLTVNYYDDYNFDLAGSFNPNTNNILIYGVYPTIRTKGLVTGSKVKVLTTSNWITTVSYYDEKARPLRTYSYNDYLKSTDLVSNDLDFVGKVKEMTSSHTYINGSLPTIITIDSLSYDHVGRLTKQTQSINDSIREVIVQNTYDELGQLVTKGVGGKTTQSRLQNVDYTYNIRGWLKQINDVNNLGTDLFSFGLSYNDVKDDIYNQVKPLYNGNISETYWKTANDNYLRNYGYKYDALNRLTDAWYGEPNNTTTKYPGTYNLRYVDYDKNGNINYLKRYEKDISGTTTGVVMDRLTYTYQNNSNKLLAVTQGSDATQDGFTDGNTVGDDYVYDANGNMTVDNNKDITAIQYNYLNLPTQVTINGQNITYVYDATGVKLRKTVNTITTDYAGNFIYENNVLQFFSHPEGYIEPDGSGGYNYIYNYTDHLGNVRVSYSDLDNNGLITPSTEILKERNYYPFGLEHSGYNNIVIGTENNHKTFQGQELNKELGLNWLSFKYRNYDPAIARFMSIDPLASKYPYNGVYNFAENKVIQYNELEGLEIATPQFYLETSLKVGNIVEGAKKLFTGATNLYNDARSGSSKVNNVLVKNKVIGGDIPSVNPNLKVALDGATQVADQFPDSPTARETFTALEVGGSALEIGSLATGPLAPEVATVGLVASGIGTLGNAYLDVKEGDITGAVVGLVISGLSAGNANLAKTAGVDKVGQTVVDGLMNSSLNSFKNRTTEKVNGKTVIKKDKQK